MTTKRFSKVRFGAGFDVTDEGGGVITIDGSGAGSTGPTGPTGPAGADGVGVPAGGTTGQALEKASGTDYDTHWVTLTGGTVAHLDDIGDVSVPSPVDEAVVNWDSGAGSWVARRGILHIDADAKGDLFAGTAADTVARLAVGSNGQLLTADSTQTTGLKWAAASAAAGTNMLAQLYGPMPGSTGSAGMYRVPYKAGSAVTYTLTRASLHLETAGSSTTTVLLEKATPSGGVFIAVLVATLTLASSATQVDVTTSLGTLTSGDLIRWRWTALGTGAQSFHAQFEGAI